ncbi:MAG: glutamate--tRNA ligase [Candidatus Marsarchaeota archaeon]|nr:glutamate--tRNA ligase [Candidatus Marsarchaeota archaeon]
MDEKIKSIIRKFALKNAIDYGKADMGSVLGKVIPQAKGMPVPELKKEVESIIREVNKMKRPELEKEYKPFEKEFEERAAETVKKTEKPNFEIEGAQNGKVITRFPPEPSGYMHVGHVKQVLISEELSRLYDGKLFLFFDDTNPAKAKQEFVDAMKKDLAWLGLKFDKEYYSSDFVETIYGYTKQLMEKGKAYVCTCGREEMKDMRFKGVECKHRSQPIEENQKLFDGMLSGRFKEGEAVVRFIGNMKAQNAVLRDPVLMRIIDKPHYKTGTKYKLWPSYDLNTPIIDSLNGITDVVRSKEYELHDELGIQILKLLGLRNPRYHLEARLNIKGNIVQKRDIRKLVEEGKLSGWDDPRLMTIMALKRRGILPDAIRNFILRLGMTKTDSTVPLDMLLAENRKLIDPIAKHLFFVADPVRLVIGNASELNVKLKLHPSAQYGFREYKTGDKFYISGDDAKEIHENEAIDIRLKDLMDIRIKTSAADVLSAEKVDDAKKGKVIQWVSEENKVKCTVLVPGPIVDENDDFNPNSLAVVEGYVESYAKKLEEHEIVQFERFGYCILDSKKKMQFIFISK